MPYRPSIELPRGYMVLGPPPGVTYLNPAPPQLSYYRQYPGMMHMAGAGSGAGVGGEQGRGKVAGAASAGVGGPPPEEAPPPPQASPTAAAAASATVATSATTTTTPPGGGGGGGGHPKESILESLLAARSERLSAASASADAEDAAAAAAAATHGADGANPPPSPSRSSSSLFGSSSTAATRAHLGGQFSGGAASKSELDSDAADVKPRMKPVRHVGPGASGTVHQPPSSSANAASRLVGVKSPHHNINNNAATAAAALHVSSLRGGFPGGMHGIGSMRAMAPPLPAVAASSNCGGGGGGGAGPSMRYMKSMGGLPPPPPPSQAPVHQQQQQSQSLGYAGHDAFDEQVRQQEKKLQKRAANRKSAQLSRKRKKALIEELRYENQDLQRHEDILEVIPDPVFAFNTCDGRVWFASTSASAQFGLPVQELNSACFFDLMTDDCSKRLRVLIETALKDVSETNSALLHEVS